MAVTDKREDSLDIDIARVTDSSWRMELEKLCSGYHLVAAWAAIIFDPIFAVTDYFNIPDTWQYVFVLRLCVAFITLSTLFIRQRYYLPSYIIVIVPFTLISLQNAYTYSLIGSENLLGHNLNYLALLIGAAMFVAWHWHYSVMMTVLSLAATAYFVNANTELNFEQFLVRGGLILCAGFFFMTMLIRTRHNLTIREIKARLALRKSNEEILEQNEEIQARNVEIHAQDEEIKGINENLESLVRERTAEIEKKTKALEEYAFINAHQLRAPVASILGLINLMTKVPTNEEGKRILEHLQLSADRLDEIVTKITKTIERGDKK